MKWSDQPQAAEAGKIGPSGHLQQQRFSSVAGRVSRENSAAAKFFAERSEFLVPPCSSAGFCASGLGGAGVDVDAEVLLFAPNLQFVGSGSRLNVPAMISMPKLELPMVQALQAHEQAE